MNSLKEIRKYGSAQKDYCFAGEIKWLEGDFKGYLIKKDLKGLKNLLQKAEKLLESKRNVYGFQNTGLMFDLIELKKSVEREIEKLEREL